jgi:hypothetical protein
MTKRRADIVLPPRLTAYVTREEGAAELRISPSTWDDLVDRGVLPKSVHRLGTIKRWRWEDVDSRLRNDDAESPEPFFRGVSSGTAKDRKRDVAA